MDTSLAGMLIMAVLLSGVVIMSRATVTSYITTGTAVREAAAVSGERERTEITFVTSTVSGSNLQVDVKNTGNISISNYAKMDFIVDYIQSPGAPEGTPNVERLTYATSSPASLQWTDLSLTPDTYQPLLWDPGETITLDANLSPGPKAGFGYSNTVLVSTPNGVVAVGTFYVP